MPMVLAPLQDGRVATNRQFSRSMMRSSGLKFHEIDIESGSPSEFQRKLVRVIEDAGFNVLDTKMNAKVDAHGVGVGEVDGEIIACRDQEIPAAVAWFERPYVTLAWILTLMFVVLVAGFGSCFLMGSLLDSSGLTFVLMLMIVGVSALLAFLPLLLALYRRDYSAPVTLSTVLRVRCDGEAYASRTEEGNAVGQRLHRAQVTSRLSVAMTVDVQGGFDAGRVPFDRATLLRRDASLALSKEALGQFEQAKQRAVAELAEIAGRVTKFSQVA